MRSRNMTGIYAISIVIYGVGCGPSPMKREFDTLMQETKKLHTAEEVRSASSAIFTNTDKEHWSVPTEIARLPLFKDGGTNNVFRAPLGATGIAFLSGGPMGHWGIGVCDDTNQIEVEFNGEAFRWDKGVFFLLGE